MLERSGVGEGIEVFDRQSMEDISFTYEKITWTFDPDGIEAEDSWLAPKS